MASDWNILDSIPVEVLHRVLNHVSLSDLTSVAQTCRYLHDVVHNSPLLWSRVDVKCLWPSENTLHWFLKSAKCGNIEASIKLAVALLYSEGISPKSIPQKPICNGEMAVELFEHLEITLGGKSQLWLLYRPPWGAQPQVCCKQYVHTRIAHIANTTQAVWAIRVLSRIEEIISGKSGSETNQNQWLKLAAGTGNPHSCLAVWRRRYWSRHLGGMLDPGTELQALRELRELAYGGGQEARLCLSSFLVSMRHPPNCQTREVVDFFAAAPQSRTKFMLQCQRRTNGHMHHVLIDWLCEVANLKLIPSATLHVAVQIMESYLSHEQITRTKFQLVGITSLLLATRLPQGTAVITVREASWVTDYTYTYSDIIRMMGQILAALRGSLMFPTMLDYASILLTIVHASPLIYQWTNFLCDLATTCIFSNGTTLAQIACGCVLLSHYLTETPCPDLASVCGFTLPQILQPALFVYFYGLLCDKRVCCINWRRQGIVDRYSLEHFSAARVGTLAVPPVEQMLQMLNMSKDEYEAMVGSSGIRTVGPSNFGGEDLIISDDDCETCVRKLCGKLRGVGEAEQGGSHGPSLSRSSSVDVVSHVEELEGENRCLGTEKTSVVKIMINTSVFKPKIETAHATHVIKTSIFQPVTETSVISVEKPVIETYVTPARSQRAVSINDAKDSTVSKFGEHCKRKRKLSDVSETEQKPEKCLIFDVGNMRLTES